MSASEHEQEPSIEEILASIRQIISDDDDEAPAKKPEPPSAPDPEPEPESEAEPAPEPAPEPEEDVIDLIDIVEDEDTGDVEEMEIDLMEPSPAAKPEEEGDDSFSALPEGDSILTDSAAEATLEGFARLATNIALTRSGQGVTLEDIIKDMLRPMLREWCDAHLPSLIERLVQQELDKISRKAMDD